MVKLAEIDRICQNLKLNEDHYQLKFAWLHWLESKDFSNEDLIIKNKLLSHSVHIMGLKMVNLPLS